MAENSNIEWTTHTFNPWIGCQKVGPGCDHCYAEVWDARGLTQRESRWGAHAARTITGSANWHKPLAWNKAARGMDQRPRVFCASLADVFDNHPSILPGWRLTLWELIKATPNLDWMLLTKRPGNIAKMLPEDWGNGYQNVWLGCTVVNQEEADRDIPKLLSVPSAVHFLSMEPLLGRVDLTPHLHEKRIGADLSVEAGGGSRHWTIPALDLVIVGGESGTNARPMNPKWARSLRDQCNAAGVAFHFKQWGEFRPPMNEADEREIRAGNGFGASIMPNGTFGNPFGSAVVRVGKKAAGRLLDGRTWDEMPVVRHA